MIKIYGAKNASVEIQPNVTYVSRMCYIRVAALNLTIRSLLAALHVHTIEIPCRAFPERIGLRILSLESVDYFGTTDHVRIEDRGIRNRGSVKKNLKIK